MELATVTCSSIEVTSIAYIFVAESGIYTVLAGDRRAILYTVAARGIRISTKDYEVLF